MIDISNEKTQLDVLTIINYVHNTWYNAVLMNHVIYTGEDSNLPY